MSGVRADQEQALLGKEKGSRLMTSSVLEKAARAMFEIDVYQGYDQQTQDHQ